MKKVRYIEKFLFLDKFLLFGFFLSILISCKNIQSPEVFYGINYNKERSRIGLIPLDSRWQYFSESPDRIWWHPINLDSLKSGDRAFYGGKMIQLNNDTLIFEGDVFVGPSSFTKENQYMRLNYIYYFVPYEMYSEGWVYSIIRQIGENDKRRTVTVDDITKNEADSILFSWGLKYQ